MIKAHTQRLPASIARLQSVTPGATSDAALIAHIAAGDKLAMQTLFSRHRVTVFRFVLRIVNDQALAEDVISETFLDVWRQAGRFEGRSAVSTWIMTIARYKAISALRGRSSDATLDDAVEIEDPAEGPELSVEKASRGEVMRKCLTGLTRDHREIIDLVYYHEKSIEEAARILSIPENTVKTRMFYARKRLGELLQAAGVDRASI